MSERNERSLPVVTEATTAGNYFVANYPPFSFWSKERVGEALAALDRGPAPGTPLGLYVHIPFCRKRCHFCYFRVYTDRNSDQIRGYLDAVGAEAEIYASKAFVDGRKPRFIYFGGGTPSYLSVAQLEALGGALKEAFSWDEAVEVTFECEPGTLSASKLDAIRALGVTRLSLGVENFDDEILQLNNRAHLSGEVFRAYGHARSIGFPQINIDLIAGMIGETDANWTRCVEKTVELDPDSVTIYQMEIPFNTSIYRDMKESGLITAPVADWPTKRRWVAEAFSRLEQAGYRIGSAYTAVKDRGAKTQFVYRDALWQGADMLGLGVASFSQIGGTHFQNHHESVPYESRIAKGELPIFRALTMSEEERLIREFVLQMKLGRLELAPFREKFGVDVKERFAAPLGRLVERGLLTLEGDTLELTRDALLRVDTLLHDFFLPQHRNARYA